MVRVEPSKIGLSREEEIEDKTKNIRATERMNRRKGNLGALDILGIGAGAHIISPGLTNGICIAL